MAESVNPEVVIVGAGLTGLTMGLYLKKAGINFLIIDKSAKTGGVIQTISEKGFVYETGPNTGVVSCPEMTELFEELAGKCELEVADPSAKRRLIWKNQAWHALPPHLAKVAERDVSGVSMKTGADEAEVSCTIMCVITR